MITKNWFYLTQYSQHNVTMINLLTFNEVFCIFLVLTSQNPGCILHLLNIWIETIHWDPVAPVQCSSRVFNSSNLSLIQLLVLLILSHRYFSSKFIYFHPYYIMALVHTSFLIWVIAGAYIA